jgi:hypothetical protein
MFRNRDQSAGTLGRWDARRVFALGIHMHYLGIRMEILLRTGSIQ